MKKRLLSVLLTVCMILTLLPVNAFAAENSYVADEFSDISSLNYDSGNDHTLAYAIWEKNDDFFVAVLAMQDVSSDDGEVVYTGDSLTVIHDKSQIQNLNAQETLKKFVDEKANKNTEWTVIQFSEDYVKKHATPDDTNEKVYIFTTDIDVQGDGHTFDNTIEVPKDFFEETGIIDPPDEPADEARTNHINIEVVLNGGTSAITSGYVDEYITVEPFQNETDGTYEDWNSGDYGNGTVTYSYTYYDCKDIGFEAKTGYVIEAIDADLVFGQSGCKGIYGITTADEKQYGEYMADNVQGGSTVTVYVRTAYTVEYYLDGEPLNYDPYNDNTLYVADTTDGLTESNGPAQNPSGSEYSRVDCNCADEGKDCPHDGLTDSEGGQPEADYLEVFDDLNKTIELPSLPGAESGGNVVFGWYESNDSTSERHDQNTSVNVADHMNRAENRVIKFYALETTPDDPELTVTKVLSPRCSPLSMMRSTLAVRLKSAIS